MSAAGLRGPSVEALLDPSFVRRISDVTAQFQQAGAALERGDDEAAAAALWPEPALQERPWPAPPELRQAPRPNPQATILQTNAAFWT